MNTTTQSEKEKALGFEIFRLMKLTRDESVDNIVSASLAGREQTVASVTKLWNFVLRNFGGNMPSTIVRKYWEASSAFLKEAGLTPEMIEKIRHPFPVAGEPGFQSVLDEFREQGLLT